MDQSTKPAFDGRPADSPAADLVPYLGRIARRCVQDGGLTHGDQDDCEITLVQHMMLRREAQMRAYLASGRDCPHTRAASQQGLMLSDNRRHVSPLVQA